MTIADLHTHTFYSADSIITPEQLLQRTRHIGLDIVCITDHSIFEESTGLEHFKDKGKKPLLIRGVELATTNGELLIFGLKRDFWKLNIRGLEFLPPIEKVIAAVNEFGGVAIWSHPFRSYNILHYDTDYKAFDGVNIIEALNGRNSIEENDRAVLYARENNFRTTGGSDAHTVNEIGKYLTLFKDDIKTEDELIQALKYSEYIPISFEDFKGKDLSKLF